MTKCKVLLFRSLDFRDGEGKTPFPLCMDYFVLWFSFGYRIYLGDNYSGG